MMICWLAIAHLSQILFSMTLWAVMRTESNFKSQVKHCQQQRVACPLMYRLQTGQSLCFCSHWAMQVRWQRCLQGSYRFTSESRQKGHVSFFLYWKSSSSLQVSSKRISICETASAGRAWRYGCLMGSEGALLKLVSETVSLHLLRQQQQHPMKTSTPRLMEATRYAILNALLANTHESSMVSSQLGLQAMHVLLGQEAQLWVEQGRQPVLALKQAGAQMEQEKLLVQKQQEEGQLVHWFEVELQY